MNPTIKWAAELSHVREVSLRGVADLEFWKQRLRPQGLLPADHDGQAQILILAADARFRGIRFRELSVSVLVAPPQKEMGDRAAYLLHAFNSNRFFAFCERKFFATPYSHARVDVSATLPAWIDVTFNGKRLFAATMQRAEVAPQRQPSRRGEDGWEGPVFLPNGNKHFFARVHGVTETYPFDPATDSIEIAPASGDEKLTGLSALAALSASAFVPRAWDIRPDCMHAKSKTCRNSL